MILTCKTCEEKMVGHIGDEICSDCAFPALKQARISASRAVEEFYTERTGKQKTCGEILRREE
jgi:hypothetical protein